MASERLLEPDGMEATVVSAIGEAHPEGVAVYNFQVEGDHTYFVDGGAGAVWVHNACSITITTPEQLAEKLRASGLGAAVPNVGNVNLRPGYRLTDIDIVTDQYVVEFKGGTRFRGNELSQKMRDINLASSKEGIIFGEGIPDNLITYLKDRGYNAFNTYDSLLGFLKR